MITKTKTRTNAAMTAGMQNLIASLPKDGTAKRVGGGVLGAARKLAALGLVVIDGSSVALVMAKPEPKAPKAPKASKKAPKPAKAKKVAAKAKKAPKAKAPSMAWPAEFPRKQQIRAQLTDDRDARVSACQLLADRTRSRRPGVTDGAACGFMSSHLSRGLAVAALISEGAKLSAADDKWLLAAIPQYARQIAAVSRRIAIQRDPRLAEVAKVYGLPEVAALGTGGEPCL